LDEVETFATITACKTNWCSKGVTSGGANCTVIGANKLVIEGLDGPRDSSPRSIRVGSSVVEWSPREVGLGTVSCSLVCWNEPCWSSIHRNGCRGGSNETSNRT
jgi:hypothetical protein